MLTGVLNYTTPHCSHQHRQISNSRRKTWLFCMPMKSTWQYLIVCNWLITIEQKETFFHWSFDVTNSHQFCIATYYLQSVGMTRRGPSLNGKRIDLTQRYQWVKLSNESWTVNMLRFDPTWPLIWESRERGDRFDDQYYDFVLQCHPHVKLGMDKICPYLIIIWIRRDLTFPWIILLAYKSLSITMLEPWVKLIFVV